MPARKHILVGVSALLWASCVVAGVGILTRYELTPGQAAGAVVPPTAFQAGEIKSAQFKLVMFVHPQCTCSQASIHELAELMTRHHQVVSASVVVLHVPGLSDDITKAPIVVAAGGIPGTAVQFDSTGEMARKFGARTSGQTFLFAPDGSPLFAGGITRSRGHVGDNPGLNTVIQLVTNPTGTPNPSATTPVFGCGLFSDLDPAVR